MSSKVIIPENPKDVEALFENWPETVIWSAHAGLHGVIYATEDGAAAAAVCGDFAFVACPTKKETSLQSLLQHLLQVMQDQWILVPRDEALFDCIHGLLGRVDHGTRYALQKDKHRFEPETLRAFAQDLPDGVTLSGMTPEIWAQISREKDWMWDFIRNFPSLEDFQSRAQGVFALQNGQILCGASSYSAFPGGIEVEIATREDWRRRHLARACGAQLILSCLEKGLTPSWDAANLPSLALAQQLGFLFTKPYRVFYLYPADAYDRERADRYETAMRQAMALVEDEPEPVPNMANLSALLHETIDRLNWVGFYTVQPDGNLLLGPFQGKPACIHIAKGKGVCGTALAEQRTILVPDVHAFPGHIACDSASRSEIVVPVMRDGRVFAVLDLDSPIPNRFTQEEADLLEGIAECLAEKYEGV